MIAKTHANHICLFFSTNLNLVWLVMSCNLKTNRSTALVHTAHKKGA